MIIIVNYRALQHDNHQGARGRPFEAKIVYNEADELTLSEMHSNAVDNVEGVQHQFVGEAQLVSIEVVRDINE